MCMLIEMAEGENPSTGVSDSGILLMKRKLKYLRPKTTRGLSYSGVNKTLA